MRVLMFQPRFVPLIENDAKFHTIRPVPKRSIEVNDYLSLRYWQDKPYRSKQIPIRDVMCKAVYRIRIHVWDGRLIIKFAGRAPVVDIKAFARADGFRSAEDMAEWWMRTHELPFEGVMIRW